ncbi:MAG TPA: leucyl/phenylalanyl-tRNA--protein transferase [Rhizomicrobium sp.]|nr:leucyl/phenylalanyl-tRNA--protein transferase [Rhizomicrobium sp.]
MHGAQRLTPELLLTAYSQGVFPMAERRDDPDLFWVSPETRGVLPLDRFHVSHRLARTVRSDRFDVRIDTAFADVMRACAAPAPGREESWINNEILAVYTALHERGHAHSIECWREDQLVGGLYGVNLGSAFFGESMFMRERDASKVALVHLVARLIKGGFTLLDAQFLTDHLARFGAIAIPRAAYMALLAAALTKDADFYCPEPSGRSGSFSFAPVSGDTILTGAVEATVGATWPGWFVLQLITQTS